MLKYKILLLICVVQLAAGPGAGSAIADTWRLTEDQDFEAVSEQTDEFLLAVTRTKELVNTGEVGQAREAYEKLKDEFPDLAGPDFDQFVKAELQFCEGRFAAAIRSYDKLLEEYPMSRLYDAALDREFAIATAYLGGHRKTILLLIKLKGYAEGVKIMEKVTDNAGFYSPIGVKAAIAVAQHYEQREKYEEAYLKWNEISRHWMIGEIGKQALLGMARSQYASYNSEPPEKRAFYDASRLRTAKTLYEKFLLLFAEDAKELGIEQLIDEIGEEIAHKQFVIGEYYERVDKPQAARLYYDMVVRNWPGSKAAEMARKKQLENPTETDETK